MPVHTLVEEEEVQPHRRRSTRSGAEADEDLNGLLHCTRLIQNLTERQALVAVAVLIAVAKAIQFALDSQVLFFFDSGGFVINALRLGFLPYRSYIYGDLIRYFALPFHSMRALVAIQVVMGGLSAWLLAFSLMRYFAVRRWIAIVAALAFACDPVQIVHEHMVMSETAAMLAMALYVVIALEYIRSRWLPLLALLAFAGILAVSLRTVYLPVVLVTAMVVPVIAFASFPPRRIQALVLALAVSCGATIVFHVGYRHLTGWIGHREPAYSYSNGAFLLMNVSPMLVPGDASDPRIAEAVVAQSKSSICSLRREFRGAQMWWPDGLIARIKKICGGDDKAADRANGKLAVAAIRRDPLGYVNLAAQSWVDYWRGIQWIRSTLQGENGLVPVHEVNAYDAAAIRANFNTDAARQDGLITPSRRYHLAAANWNIFLLLAPFLAVVALMASSTLTWRQTAFLFLWSSLLLISTCFSESDPVLRYVHPFSFIGLASVAMIGERLAQRFGHQRSSMLPECDQTPLTDFSTVSDTSDLD